MSAASFPGWTLSEAFKKIVPDEFFLALQDANVNADRAASFADGAMRRPDAQDGAGEILKAMTSSGVDLRRAKQNVYDRFRYSALRGDVIVTGFANDDGYHSVIPTQAWTELDGFLESRSAVGKRPDDAPDALLPDSAFLAVSIFPVLRAPIEVVVECLSSELLSTVLDRFFWSDPEALKIWNDRLRRGDRLPNDTPEVSSDRAVLLVLHQDARKMRREIDRVGVSGKLGLDATEDRSAASQYLDVLADRLAALGELIATEVVGLSGLDEALGKKINIDCTDIEAGRLLLCLGTGDFYRSDEGGGAIRNVRVTAPAVLVLETDKLEITTADNGSSDRDAPRDQKKRGAPDGWDWDAAISSAFVKMFSASNKDVARDIVHLKSLKHAYELIEEECAKQNKARPAYGTVEDKLKKNDKYKIIFKILSDVISSQNTS